MKEITTSTQVKSAGSVQTAALLSDASSIPMRMSQAVRYLEVRLYHVSPRSPLIKARVLQQVCGILIASPQRLAPTRWPGNAAARRFYSPRASAPWHVG